MVDVVWKMMLIVIEFIARNANIYKSNLSTANDFFFRWIIPMSNLAETIQKNDFQNLHTFHFEMVFFHLGCCLPYNSYKTYFYHHLSRQYFYLCSTFLDHITLLLSFLFCCWYLSSLAVSISWVYNFFPMEINNEKVKESNV